MLKKMMAMMLLVVAAGCASQDVKPREYLDETTAATITVVANPWVFVETPAAASSVRDFLNVYAIDVNRSGNHRQYLAVLQWWPRESASKASGPANTLELKVGDQPIALPAADQEPRKLGIAQPLDTVATQSAQWHYFPVDKSVLDEMAVSRVSSASLAMREGKIEYTPWKEARAEVAAFTTVLR